MTRPAEQTQTLIEKIQSLPSERIEEVEDFVDFLKTRSHHRKINTTKTQALDFPVDDLGIWPDGLSLSRKDLYGDSER